MRKFSSLAAALLAAALTFALFASQAALAAADKADDGIAATKEDVAESLARSACIAYAEAFSRLTDSENELFAEKGADKRRRAASVSYRYYAVEYQAVPFLLRLNAWAYVQIWNQAGSREFTEIMDTGSEREGLLFADWAPAVSANLTAPTRLDLSCRGYLSRKIAFNATISEMFTFSNRWDID